MSATLSSPSAQNHEVPESNHISSMSLPFSRLLPKLFVIDCGKISLESLDHQKSILPFFVTRLQMFSIVSLKSYYSLVTSLISHPPISSLSSYSHSSFTFPFFLSHSLASFFPHLSTFSLIFLSHHSLSSFSLIFLSPSSFSLPLLSFFLPLLFPSSFSFPPLCFSLLFLSPSFDQGPEQ